MGTRQKACALCAMLVLSSTVFAQTDSSKRVISGAAKIKDKSTLDTESTRITGGFVKRSGSRLMLNGKTFRFAGANLDNLALASDRFSLIVSISGTTDQYYPSEFAIDNAFETLRRMGGTVARIYSAGSQGSPLAIEPSLGKFNERALKQLDYVVKSAGDHGVRLDLVLVSQQDYYVGGRPVLSTGETAPASLRSRLFPTSRNISIPLSVGSTVTQASPIRMTRPSWRGKQTTRSTIHLLHGKAESAPTSRSSIRIIL